MTNLFFDRLQILIATKKLNQKQLSELIGVNERTVSRWRDKDPDIKNIVAISEATECSLDWLRTGEGPMFKYQPPPGDQVNFDLKAAKPKADNPAPLISEENFNMPEMVKMTMEILASETVYRSALASNIRAFHKAVNMEKEMNEVRQEISAMAERMARMEEMLLSLGASLPAEKREQNQG